MLSVPDLLALLAHDDVVLALSADELYAAGVGATSLPQRAVCLASLGRDCHAQGAAGAALLRPTVAQAACDVALRAMKTFPWDKPVQQRACLLLVRLLRAHGPWMEKYARRDENTRLKRVRLRSAWSSVLFPFSPKRSLFIALQGGKGLARPIRARRRV